MSTWDSTTITHDQTCITYDGLNNCSVTKGGSATEEVRKKRPPLQIRTEEELKSVLLPSEVQEAEVLIPTEEASFSITVPLTLDAKTTLEALVAGRETEAGALGVEELSLLKKKEQVMLLLLLDELT